MDVHLNEKMLAHRLGLSLRTLQRWRWQGKGPAYLKLGGRVVYRLRDVELWEERNRQARPADIEQPAAKS